jgi:hypothetical protein
MRDVRPRKNQTMNKLEKHLNFFTGFLIPAAWLLTVQPAHSKEPYYNGRPLSEWICCASPDEQQNAIQNIGTNAIPVLLDLLGANDKNIKRVAARLNSKGLREAVSDENGIYNIRDTVAKAFWILGTNAEYAIPKLVQLLNKDDEDVSPYAAAVLVEVGPGGLAALKDDLTTRNSSVREDIVLGIGQNGQDPKMVVQVLIPFLKDESADVRRLAAGGLAKRDPATAIPALIPMLDDTDLDVRQWAASAIGSYGSEARSAAPKIFALYTNSLDQGLFEVLKQIDLETAGKAEDVVIHSGPLNPFRKYYTKTELKNGLELIAGGWIQTSFPSPASRCLSSAELYDPRTGKWHETGQMNTARFGHTAVLLSDGRVLVAAGIGMKGFILSSEIFDPQTEKWTETGPLKKGNGGGQIILQPDGKALFVDGIDYPNQPPYDKELYDPATGTWTEIMDK